MFLANAWIWNLPEAHVLKAYYQGWCGGEVAELIGRSLVERVCLKENSGILDP